MREEKIRSTIAICAMSFITLASSATSPALSTISKNFPDASSSAIASIATISSLTAVIFTGLAGLLVGKKVKFKLMAAIGLFITTVGGVIPYISNTINEILIGRAILGIGTGLLVPIVSILTLSLFEGKEVAKQLSRNMMATNFGAVVFQLSGGFLCNYGWRMPFLTYFAVVPVLLIVIFFLPEPKKVVTKYLMTKPDESFSVKKIFTPHVIFWGVLHALYMIFFYPYVTEMSGIVSNSGYGTAMTTAIVLSTFTASGVFGGYSFYFLNNHFGIKTFTLGFGIGAISYIWLMLAGNIINIILASVLFGIGYGIIAPCIHYYFGIKLKPQNRATSVAVQYILCHLGSFGSPFILGALKQIINTSWDRFSFFCGTGFFVVASAGFLLYKKKY